MRLITILFVGLNTKHSSMCSLCRERPVSFTRGVYTLYNISLLYGPHFRHFHLPSPPLEVNFYDNAFTYNLLYSVGK